MKKTSMSLVAAMLLSSSAIMADSITEAFDNGKLSGQFRTFYIDRTYSGTTENNRNSLALGGHLGYETAPFYGLSLGARLYSTTFIDIHDGDSRDVNSYDPSLFGDNFDSYTFIGELYANYKIDNTNIKIGRQRLDTPLAGADDARMLPNLFEAAVVSNTDIKDTTLIAAHVTKESVGTFGNVYPANALGLQSGYGLGYKDATSGKFKDMGEVALGSGVDTDGVSAVAAIYSGIPGLKLQAWDYYAYDILNAIYLQADYGWNCLLNPDVKMTGSLQYINESDTGDKLAGDVDSNYWAAKLGATYKDAGIYAAYSQTGSSAGSQMNGGIITPWGGMPAFTQAVITRHQFFADTNTWKVGASYNFKNMGIPLLASVFHTTFDIGAANTYQSGKAWKATEDGFDLTYTVNKNLELRLRANYPRDFAPNMDMDEYRVILNYNF
ncbi:MAG: OprD family outer membrane porin [Sulfurovaceae bacterium]|nr:OprD family outer membrane porin [Sulfurovaceae bacterium]